MAGGDIYNAPAAKDLELKYDHLPPIEPVFPGYGEAGDLAGAERFVS